VANETILGLIHLTNEDLRGKPEITEVRIANRHGNAWKLSRNVIFWNSLGDVRPCPATKVRFGILPTGFDRTASHPDKQIRTSNAGDQSAWP
jgi:hypothetical protein